MQWWVLIPVAYFAYQYFSDLQESEKEKEIARIEAELKLKLVDRLGDPELVRKVVESRLPHTSEDGEADTDAIAAELERDAHPATPAAETGAGFRSFLAFVGLVSFLVGLALLVSAFIVDTSVSEGLKLSGMITSAAGLAFLTFATSRKQIRKQIQAEPATES